jgi:hypothetical protein
MLTGRICGCCASPLFAPERGNLTLYFRAGAGCRTLPSEQVHLVQYLAGARHVFSAQGLVVALVELAELMVEFEIAESRVHTVALRQEVVQRGRAWRLRLGARSVEWIRQRDHRTQQDH